MTEIETTFEKVEQWRDVVGFEGLYEVSDGGRVRRSTRSKKVTTSVPGHVMKPSTSGRYHSICLLHSGSRFCTKVHILVARSFLGPISEGFQVHHKDRDRGNNRAENLEIIPQLLHGRIHHLGNKYSRGNRLAKLNPELVVEVRRLAMNGIFHREIASSLSISRSTVSRAVRGDTWSYVGPQRLAKSA